MDNYFKNVIFITQLPEIGITKVNIMLKFSISSIFSILILMCSPVIDLGSSEQKEDENVKVPENIKEKLLKLGKPMEAINSFPQIFKDDTRIQEIFTSNNDILQVYQTLKLWLKNLKTKKALKYKTVIEQSNSLPSEIKQDILNDLKSTNDKKTTYIDKKTIEKINKSPLISDKFKTDKDKIPVEEIEEWIKKSLKNNNLLNTGKINDLRNNLSIELAQTKMDLSLHINEVNQIKERILKFKEFLKEKSSLSKDEIKKTVDILFEFYKSNPSAFFELYTEFTKNMDVKTVIVEIIKYSLKGNQFYQIDQRKEDLKFLYSKFGDLKKEIDKIENCTKIIKKLSKIDERFGKILFARSKEELNYVLLKYIISCPIDKLQAIQKSGETAEIDIDNEIKYRDSIKPSLSTKKHGGIEHENNTCFLAVILQLIALMQLGLFKSYEHNHKSKKELLDLYNKMSESEKASYYSDKSDSKEIDDEKDKVIKSLATLGNSIIENLRKGVSAKKKDINNFLSILLQLIPNSSFYTNEGNPEDAIELINRLYSILCIPMLHNTIKTSKVNNQQEYSLSTKAGEHFISVPFGFRGKSSLQAYINTIYKTGELVKGIHIWKNNLYTKSDKTVKQSLEPNCPDDLLYIKIERGTFDYIQQSTVKSSKDIKVEHSIELPCHFGKSKLKYELNAVIIHIGNPNGEAHFVICKKINDKWYLYNDLDSTDTQGQELNSQQLKSYIGQGYLYAYKAKK